MDQWQPIDTAPKDGTWYLTYGPEGHGMARYMDCMNDPDMAGWFEGAVLDTHWMPLPAAPTETPD
jgi:hypothetical protein